MAGVVASGIGMPGAVAQERDTTATAGADRYEFVLSSAGSEARYRVREQLAGLDFPNDAVGSTSAIEGSIVVDPDGAVVWNESRFVVDLTTLESDEDRRDRYIQRNTLETDRHPTAELTLTRAEGLPESLPQSGTLSFRLFGELTLHGETRSTVWEVEAALGPTEVTGTATTSFTFDYFRMRRPRVAVVLSVEDEIRLELDFRLVRTARSTD
jgi:polyisoprenoid-binding protein YceI